MERIYVKVILKVTDSIAKLVQLRKFVNIFSSLATINSLTKNSRTNKTVTDDQDSGFYTELRCE